MAKIPRASGFLIFCREPELRFLLMKHTDRWDLPKGHVDEGESDLDAAYRELLEETGIKKSEVEMDPDFRFEIAYEVSAKKYTGKKNDKVLKTVVIFLGFIPRKREIEVSEHPDYKWFKWNPPHAIQEKTIDPLLAEVESFLETKKIAS